MLYHHDSFFLKTWHNVIANPPFAVFDSTEELLPLKTQCSLLYSNVNTGGLYCREKDVQLIKTAKLCVLIWSKIIWIFIFDLLEPGGYETILRCKSQLAWKLACFVWNAKSLTLTLKSLLSKSPRREKNTTIRLLYKIINEICHETQP